MTTVTDLWIKKGYIKDVGGKELKCLMEGNLEATELGKKKVPLLREEKIIIK